MKEEHVLFEDEYETDGPWGPDGVPDPVMRLVADWFVRAYDKYVGSKHYRNLNLTAKTYAYAVLHNFVMMMLVEVGETPHEWSQGGIEFVFDELLPHDVRQTRGYEQYFAEVVLSFLRWLGCAKVLPQARQLSAAVKRFLSLAAERCDCPIRNQALELAERVMQNTGLNRESLFDRALFIAKYTQVICGETETKADKDQHVDVAEQNLDFSGWPVMSLTCPCGSGKNPRECCGGCIN